MNKFAHHGADDDHRRFTAGGEAGFEGLAPFRLRDRDHRRHVHGFAEEGMAHFGNFRFSADTAAGFMLPRIKACIGRCLPGILETRRRLLNRFQSVSCRHERALLHERQASTQAPQSLPGCWG